jgi:TetR/AcrR family transcriptional regulator, transcriptional repressor for nem operon
LNLVEPSAAFRERGVNGASLTDVMQQVDLTHGGFYAHFKSKDELIAAALKSVNPIRLARFKDAAAESSHGSGLAAAVDVYLSSRHREYPESGCAIATLGSELARERGSARHQMR